MGVRIDQLLHWLCLAPSRSHAARGCKEGAILLNGRPVRPSQPVAAGDWISIADRRREVWRTLEIVMLPTHQLSRVEARAYLRAIDADRPAAGAGASHD